MAKTDWKGIGNMLLDVGAPILGTALLGPAGGVLGTLVASLVGSDPSPESVASALLDPSKVQQIIQYEGENEFKLRELIANQERETLKEVNITAREELKVDDKFVRRWRPFFGYVVACTWAGEVLAIITGILVVVFMAPTNSADILNGLTAIIGALGTQWVVALSVLGVTAYKRSQDKMVQAGMQPTALFSLIGRKGANGTENGAVSGPGLAGRAGNGGGLDGDANDGGNRSKHDRYPEFDGKGDLP